MYAEASAQARCYQSEGTRRARSISELGARPHVTPDPWLGRAEPWGAEMSFGRDRLVKDWLYRATTQILYELECCPVHRTRHFGVREPRSGLVKCGVGRPHECIWS